jgi:hypothetical protein
MFFLGTHRPNWLGIVDVPLFVSRTTLGRIKRKFPRARQPWCMDSGGFSEVVLRGGWTVSPSQYIDEVRRCQDNVGQMLWAAPQDWMCEPVAIAATGLSVKDHQRRTVENYLELMTLAPDLPWIPVLQGWMPADYEQHARDYAAAGIDLAGCDTVGVGSVCRRQGTSEAVGILTTIARAVPGIQMHGFGFKREGISQAWHLLRSADSLAWSYAARMSPPMPGCTHKGKCANCMRYALAWREETLNPRRRGAMQIDMWH